MTSLSRSEERLLVLREIDAVLAEAPVVTAELIIEAALESAEGFSAYQTLTILRRTVQRHRPDVPLTAEAAAALPLWVRFILARWPALVDDLASETSEAAEGSRTRVGGSVYRALVEGLEPTLPPMVRRAVAALRRRDPQSAAFTDLETILWSTRIPDQLMDELTAALQGPTRTRCPRQSSMAATRFVAALPLSLSRSDRVAIGFALMGRADRVARLLTGGPDLVSGLVAAGGVADIAGVLVARPDQAAFTTIAEAMEKAEVVDQVAEHLLGGTHPDATPGTVVTALYRLLAHVSLRADLVARIVELPGVPSYGDALLENLETLEVTALGDAVPARLLRGSSRWEDGFWTRDRRHRLQAKLTDEIARRGLLGTGSPDDGLLLDALDVARTATEAAVVRHGLLLDARIREALGPSTVAAALGAQGSEAAWAALLERLDPVAGRLPEDLAALATADAERLAAVLRDRPRAIELPTLLDGAFRSRKVARIVERAVPRADLRTALPWVRERFAANPTRAAVFEVATAFALDYWPYLLTVAAGLTLPATDEQRGRQLDGRYRTYELPKRAGGTRTITVPEPALKGFQRHLLREGFAHVPLHDAATGFRPGLSIVDNAAVHAGREVVVNVDIASFFPSTSYRQILRACGQLGDGALSPRAIRFLADLCSYGGGLPTGAPTSPAIANIVLRSVDRSVATAAARLKVRYTRYADDLTFSGDHAAVRMIPFARRLLAENGYRLDDRKTGIYRRGRRQVVTGLVVNERPNVARITRRRLRAARHRVATGRQPEWQGRPMDAATLHGWTAFEAMVRAAPRPAADEPDGSGA